MHELSIIASIVEIAEQHARQAGSVNVESIELEIGELAGVEWGALEFAWEAGTSNTVLENAKMQLTKVPGMARCLECYEEYPIEAFFDPCPSCGSFMNEILSGRELRVKALTIA
jgi:hydrogenase nickel incorporation protein HypA/HybF